MDPRISVMELKGEMFIPFLSWYNSSPPISDENPDRIFIFKKPGYSKVVIAFVTKECVTAVASTSVYSMRRFLPINGPALESSALNISAQLEFHPTSCAYGLFGAFTRAMSASFPSATMRVIRGGLGGTVS